MKKLLALLFIAVYLPLIGCSSSHNEPMQTSTTTTNTYHHPVKHTHVVNPDSSSTTVTTETY
jgi:uncharacterized protein YcfL